jgi:large subunit ribosomal protein L34
MSKTYQPKKKKRVRTHGFLKRKSTVTGKKVMQNRRRKGRAKIAL